MVTPLPHLGAYSSLMERVPPTSITTPGGMSLNLSRLPRPKQRSRWDANFLLLLQFRDREGHLRVPRRHVEDGQKLGAWICRHRAQKKAGTLVSEKERRLKNIGFIWNALEGNWDTMFRALTQFKQREGHLRVSTQHVEGGLKLGRWISIHRSQRSNGTLCPEEERRLDEIGFIWDAHEGHWDSMFWALTQFKKREGHLRIPTQHVEDGKKLGGWIRMQRAQKKDGTLVAEKERRLNDIGFIWKGHEGSWDTMIRALAQFKQREGHLRVPRSHVEDDLQLGRWISSQRAQKIAGTLYPEFERRLDEIGFIWNPYEGNWDTMFSVLTQFKQREGHLRVPTQHVEDGKKLGGWIRMQRAQEKDGTLVPEKSCRLKEIGFVLIESEINFETRANGEWRVI
jgi:hypothetical protein